MQKDNILYESWTILDRSDDPILLIGEWSLNGEKIGYLVENKFIVVWDVTLKERRVFTPNGMKTFDDKSTWTLIVMISIYKYLIDNLIYYHLSPSRASVFVGRFRMF